MARDKSIKIRLNDFEYDFVEKQAEKLGITKSEYIRKLLFLKIESAN